MIAWLQFAANQNVKYFRIQIPDMFLFLPVCWLDGIVTIGVVAGGFPHHVTGVIIDI